MAASNWPTKPGVSCTEMPNDQDPLQQQGAGEADRNVERRERDAERQRVQRARAPATRRPCRPAARGERSTRESRGGCPRSVHDAVGERARRAAPGAPPARPRAGNATTSSGGDQRGERDDAGDLRRLRERHAADRHVRRAGRRRAGRRSSSATTARPSKIRSTATDESTALKRAPASRARGEHPHQLARAEGQDVVGHEPDRDRVPERHRQGGDRRSSRRAGERQRTRRSGKVSVATTTATSKRAECALTEVRAPTSARWTPRSAQTSSAAATAMPMTAESVRRAPAVRARLRIRQARAGRGRAAPAAAAGSPRARRAVPARRRAAAGRRPHARAPPGPR